MNTIHNVILQAAGILGLVCRRIELRQRNSPVDRPKHHLQRTSLGVGIAGADVAAVGYKVVHGRHSEVLGTWLHQDLRHLSTC